MVDFETDELFDGATFGGDGGVPDTKKWIEHRPHARDAVQFYAPFSELDRKCGRMRPFLRPALDRFVGDKPGVAAAACVAPAGVRPASDIALVLIRHAERQPVDVDLAVDGEVKNVFVAIIQESFGTDWLKMSECPIVDGDRFDPMNGVLEKEQVAQLKNNFVRKHRI